LRERYSIGQADLCNRRIAWFAKYPGLGEYSLETNVPGVLAAGDVRHGSVKRYASAVGEGAMAVTFVHHYLVNG
jgi:thioredoxin reductase